MRSIAYKALINSINDKELIIDEKNYTYDEIIRSIYKIKLLLQNRKIDSIILFISYADNGTFIVQSRTKLHTKVVRDYLPNSYEIGA